jgi:sortase family protein
MAQNTPSRGGSIFDKVPLPVIGGLAAVVLIGIVVVAVVLSGGGGDSGDPAAVTTPASGGLQTAQPTAVATADLTQPTAVAENLPSIGENDRLIIPRFSVDAPLTYRAVGQDGVMPNPDGPDDIAYYDFSAWPGKGGRPGLGNPVFAGHVDSGHVPCANGTVQPPCEAVLWDLNNLTLGDEIHVVVGDTLYKYAVTSNEPVDAETGPWDQIVSATMEPSLTIITCGGDFNRETGEYDMRQVLKASFVAEEPVS